MLHVKWQVSHRVRGFAQRLENSCYIMNELSLGCLWGTPCLMEQVGLKIYVCLGLKEVGLLLVVEGLKGISSFF